MTEHFSTAWRKSRFCDGGGCVEMRWMGPNEVALRNSGNPDGPVLVFTKQEWDAFVAGIRAGDFEFGN